MADLAIRKPALSGLLAGSPTARVTVAPVASRLSLRAPAESLSALSSALGVALPTVPKASGRTAGRSALWLGPELHILGERLSEAPLDNDEQDPNTQPTL